MTPSRIHIMHVISGLEQGRRNPTVITVYELAVALGVSYLDLLKPAKMHRK